MGKYTMFPLWREQSPKPNRECVDTFEELFPVFFFLEVIWNYPPTREISFLCRFPWLFVKDWSTLSPPPSKILGKESGFQK